MKTKAIAASVIDTLGRIGIYGIGTDSAIYYKIWDGEASLPSKTGWLSMKEQFDSAPAILQPRFEFSPWRAEVFALSLNYEMLTRDVPSFSWPPPAFRWKPLGGIFNSPPSALT